MLNLIHVNMRRLMRNRCFQIACLVVAVIALFEITMIYQDYVLYQGDPYFDNALFTVAAAALFPMAIVTSLFIGVEYTEGTLRNKLIVGCKRSHIYLANLFVATVSAWFFLLVWSVFYLVPGMILMENANPLSLYLKMYGTLMCTLAAFSAIFTGLSMIIAKKAAAAIACLLLMLALLMGGVVIQSTLDQEEFYTPSFKVTESGEVEYDGKLEPNPNYLPEGSSQRAVYEFLQDFTPGGQVMQIAAIQSENAGKIAVYDFCWFVVVTAAGMLLFKRKNIK